MRKLRNTKVLTSAAMLSAIGILLGFFKISISQIMEIRFGGLPIGVGSYLFGPAVGAVIGAIADIGGYIVKPTGPFFPGFTISAIVTGIIFGLVLHKKKVTIWRVFVAELIHTVIVNVILNGIWLTILYNNAFWAVLGSRLLKQIIMLPIQTAMLYVLLQAVCRVGITEKTAEAEG